MSANGLTPGPDPVASGAPTSAGPAEEPILEFRNVRIVYDGAIEAVRDVSLEVPPREVVALLGSNGAGKSTLLKAMSGLLSLEDGVVEAGEIRHRGRPIGTASADSIVRRGVVQVPEGRRVFVAMSVEENLRMGGFLRSPAEGRRQMTAVFDLFPRLAERRGQIAGFLSGGEQQMLAIGRALMSGPEVLALDEPSLGLAPLVIDRIYKVIERLRSELGLSVLLVEQNARRALEIADRGYILENGRVVLDGTAASLSANEDVREFYLGVAKAGTKSLREVKHYKRRKRWLS